MRCVPAISIPELPTLHRSPTTPHFNALTRIWDNMAFKKIYITGGIPGSRAHGVRVSVRTTSLTTTLHIARSAHRSPTSTGTTACSSPPAMPSMPTSPRARPHNGVPSRRIPLRRQVLLRQPVLSMGQHERRPWFGCACCPGNVTRLHGERAAVCMPLQGDDVLVNL